MAYDSGSGKTIIRFNKLLNFQVKGEGKEMKTTDWLMHEFSVAEKGSDLVLCVIYKKKKKVEERGLALALERPPSVIVDSGILGSPKSVFDQVDFFDDTGMGVKTRMMIKTHLMKVPDLLPLMVIRNSKYWIHKKMG